MGALSGPPGPARTAEERPDPAPQGQAGAAGRPPAAGTDGQEPAPGRDGRRAVQEERRRFRTAVEREAARRERFRREGFRGFWFGLSSFGMVGWSIAVPTLLGIALGLWLDARWGGGRRYTISLMVAGLAVGMHNVWRWLRLQEEAEAGQEETDPGPANGDGPQDAAEAGGAGGDGSVRAANQSRS